MGFLERVLQLTGGAVISYFLGGGTILLSTLIILYMFDYVTGLTGNWQQWSSQNI